MTLTVLVVLVAWTILSIALGLLLGAVIRLADRRERAEVARRVAAVRACESVAVSFSHPG